MGYLGSDVQLHTLSTGRKVGRVRLATNEYYTDKAGERQQHTEWHNLTGWGGVAEHMERIGLTKGMQVFIEGKLAHRAYDDKNGNKRYLSEIVISEIVVPTNKANAA